MEAQTRAKTARVKADLRQLASAIELYSVDNNGPPLDWSVPRGEPKANGMQDFTTGVLFPGYVDAATGAIHGGLTTPIAYIADCWITDPFARGASYEEIPFDQQKYTYNLFVTLRGVEPWEDYLLAGYDDFYGWWRLGSIGPDRDIYNGAGPFQASRIYDPTNGTRSAGNIWRSQREPDVHGRSEMDMFLDP
jgi:hypothetical protein